MEPFLDALGNKARTHVCPAYVTGLIGSEDASLIVDDTALPPARQLGLRCGASKARRCAGGMSNLPEQPEIASPEIDRMRASGVRFGRVLPIPATAYERRSAGT